MTAALIPAAAEVAEGTAAKAASSGAGKAAAGKAGKAGAGRSGAGKAGKAGARTGGRTPATSPASPAAPAGATPATPAAPAAPAAPAGKPGKPAGMVSGVLKSTPPGQAVRSVGAPVRALGAAAENQTVQAGSGFLLGVFAWALGLAYLQYGPAGVKKLLAAKFLNVGSDDAGSF